MGLGLIAEEREGEQEGEGGQEGEGARWHGVAPLGGGGGASLPRQEKLGEGDLEDHGGGEDGGVADVGEVVAGLFLGEGQDGGLGLEAREEARQQAQGDLEEAVADPEGGEADGGGDNRACAEQGEAVGAGEGGAEGLACAGADARQEEHEAELSQGEVDAVGHAPDQGSGAAEGAQDEGDDQRPARDAELEGEVAGEGDGDEAQREAQAQAQAEAQDVHLAGGLVGVAEEAGDGLDLVAVGEDADAVAEFEDGVSVWDELDVAASEAGDDGAEVLGEVEVGESLACDLGVGDEDASVVEA